MAERDAASRAFAYASKLPGGSGNPPSATTSGREELADGEASLASSRAGPEAINPAVERREASVADATQGARWRLRATITGPPTGAAAPERLSALRFPLCLKREPCKPRRA